MKKPEEKTLTTTSMLRSNQFRRLNGEAVLDAGKNLLPNTLSTKLDCK